MGDDASVERVAHDLDELMDEWREEIAKTNQRARNMEGSLKDEYDLRGRASGLRIALTDLQEALSDDE